MVPPTVLNSPGKEGNFLVTLPPSFGLNASKELMERNKKGLKGKKGSWNLPLFSLKPSCVLKIPG